MTSKPLPKIEAIDKPAHLWNWGGGATFYRVTPVPGARMAATIAVKMSSQDVRNPDDYYGPRVNVPAAYFDLCPTHDDNGGPARESEPLTINGKTYSLSHATAHVQFDPVPVVGEYGNHATVNGQTYRLRSSASSYDSHTDAARELIYRVVEAIAAGYVTAERWHAYRVVEAEKVVADAEAERDKAQAKVGEARGALAAILAEVVK